MFVPCTNAVVQVTVNGNSFATGWTAPMSTPDRPSSPTGQCGKSRPATATSSPSTNPPAHTLTSHHLGRVPSRFASPANGDSRVVAAARRVVYAFGD